MISGRVSSHNLDQERVTELGLLLNLLQYFLGHEFELRLFSAYDPSSNGTKTDDEADERQLSLTTVDVTLVCIGHLLPLITESVLAVSYYHDAYVGHIFSG